MNCDINSATSVFWLNTENLVIFIEVPFQLRVVNEPVIMHTFIMLRLSVSIEVINKDA